ncbi:hypothetical protein N7486_007928 [Penicillium sp. IBT 16267x]|nr:hypothetical protein N7486_007928 [Penicillium sp. IBT 16267x]
MAQRHETYDEIRQYLTQFAAISDVLFQRQAVGEWSSTGRDPDGFSKLMCPLFITLLLNQNGEP